MENYCVEKSRCTECRHLWSLESSAGALFRCERYQSNIMRLLTTVVFAVFEI